MKKSPYLWTSRLPDFKPISHSISNRSADLSLHLNFLLSNSFICRWHCSHGQASSLLRHRPKRLVQHHRLVRVEKRYLRQKQPCHRHHLSFSVSHRDSSFLSWHSHRTRHSFSPKPLTLWTDPLPCQPHFSPMPLPWQKQLISPPFLQVSSKDSQGYKT